MKLRALPLSAILLALALFSPQSFAATYYYLQPYKDRTQNPFWQGVVDGTAYLEDFEDGVLDTPNVTVFGTQSITGKNTRSIDGDDGKVDGKTLGYSLTSSPIGTGANIYFEFSPDSNGKLPSYVGAAAFFGAYSGPPEFNQPGIILAYDANGIEITGGEWKTPVPILDPGAPSADAYRFSGMYYEGGIARLVFPQSANIDHLTYGYAIPEPAAGALLLGALGAGVIRRRR